MRKFKEEKLSDEVSVNGVWALSEQEQRNLVKKMLGEWKDIK